MKIPFIGSLLPAPPGRSGFLAVLLGGMFVFSNAMAIPRGLPGPEDPLYQMRDPFRRPKSARKDEVPKTEIELIPIEQFSLVGVSTGPRNSRALVRTEGGKSWFVGLNDLIGTNGGVVRGIFADRIVVSQKVLDEVGQEQAVTAEIKFADPRKPGGSP